MSCDIPSDEAARPQSSKIRLAVQTAALAPEEGERREGAQHRHVHCGIDRGLCRVRGQERSERAGAPTQFIPHVFVVLSLFLKDRALRGLESGRRVFAPRKLGAVFKDTFTHRIHLHPSRSTRPALLLGLRSGGMGCCHVDVSESGREYPAWHVQLHDLLIPRLGGLERPQDAPLA